MTALYGFLEEYWTLEINVELLIPVFMLARRLPRRPHHAARIVCVAAFYLALSFGSIALGLSEALNMVNMFLLFSAMLVVLTATIKFVYQVSVWPALFCATAGYTLQNLASGATVLIRILITGSVNTMLDDPLRIVVDLATYTTVYVVGYLVFVRPLSENGLLGVSNKAMLLMLAVVAVAIIGFDVLLKDIASAGIGYTRLVLLRLLFLGICIFVLFVEYELLFAQKASEDKALAEALLDERERQYQLSRSQIDSINIKCHDIRSQIHALARSETEVDRDALDDIAREVNVYEAMYETGDEALDTILTERALACGNEGITFAVIADGSALGFMAPADVYALFGSALENAIEAVRLVEDPEERTIALNIQRRGGMVAISIENRCAREPEFRDDLPVSTKEGAGGHGLGARSIRATVERYGGSMHMGARDGVFYLNILLPMPER